jgi:hypothetical protein
VAKELEWFARMPGDAACVDVMCEDCGRRRRLYRAAIVAASSPYDTVGDFAGRLICSSCRSSGGRARNVRLFWTWRASAFNGPNNLMDAEYPKSRYG